MAVGAAHRFYRLRGVSQGASLGRPQGISYPDTRAMNNLSMPLAVRLERILWLLEPRSAEVVNQDPASSTRVETCRKTRGAIKTGFA